MRPVCKQPAQFFATTKTQDITDQPNACTFDAETIVSDYLQPLAQN